jgi:hypothetical protein
MDLKTFATLALLGYTNGAAAGIRNVSWPVWETGSTASMIAGATANTYTTTLVGSYPVGCVRSRGFATMPQNIAGEDATVANRITATSAVNKTFWGSTVAHTGNFTGGAAAVGASSTWAFNTGVTTHPVAGTVAWGCCTDIVGSATSVFCAASTYSTTGAAVYGTYKGLMWFSYARMITATAGTPYVGVPSIT